MPLRQLGLFADVASIARNEQKTDMVRRYHHRPNAAFRTAGRADQDMIENLSLDFEDSPDSAQFDDDSFIRKRWRTLVDHDLPEAADRHKEWPVYLNHCFARILLDNAVGQFWRDVIAPPAWKNTPLPVLQTAIDLGEAILSGDADIWALNDTSLVMRGKPKRGRKAAVGRRRRFAPKRRR